MGTSMSGLSHDVRFALRAIQRHPGFLIMAAVIIALGIGANTAIFSVVDGVLLRALPFPDPDRLVTVWENHERRDGPRTEWTGRSTFFDWREQNRVFAGLAVVTDWSPALTGAEQPEVVPGALVSPGYFSNVLGVPPALGRDFLSAEERPGSNQVVVLGHEVWTRRFGADPDLVGRSLTLDGNPYTVVGILPAGFEAPIIPGAQIWSPLPLDPGRADRGNYYLRVIGRYAPGITAEVAEADMSRVARAIAEQNPVFYRDVGVTLVPLRDAVVGDVRTALLVLLGAVGLILLIACANVANLLLARGSVREREFAVRGALGAGRLRLVRQLLTESIVLALVGGGLGFVLGVWGTRLLVSLTPTDLPRSAEIGLHPSVFLFALGATLLTGLLFGLAPALSLSRGAASDALREGGRGAASARGGRLRNALVVLELALGMSVLVAAGLLLRSFAELRRVDPGFRVDHVLSGRIQLPATRYERGEQIVAFLRRLEEGVRAAPGVHSVGATTVLPLSGLIHDVSFGIEGRLPPPGESPAADVWRATPGFFEAMRIQLRHGRSFAFTDDETSELVMLISESLAERYFSGENPIGKRMRVGGVQDPTSPWWTIVGVVGTVRTRDLAGVPEPEIFLPMWQRPARGISIVVRTAGGRPHALAPQLRELVSSLDPEMPVSELATLEEVWSTSIGSQRFMSQLLGAFAALALVLGCVGIYGVMAFSISQRTREIGIRMALGARGRDVLHAVLRKGIGLTLAGVAVGLAGSMAASRALSGLLFRVDPIDPATLIAVSLLLTCAALFACYWPARRATRVDPALSLRSE